MGIEPLVAHAIDRDLSRAPDYETDDEQAADLSESREVFPAPSCRTPSYLRPLFRHAAHSASLSPGA